MNWKKYVDAIKRDSESDTVNMGIGINRFNKYSELLKISWKSRLWACVFPIS